MEDTAELRPCIDPASSPVGATASPDTEENRSSLVSHRKGLKRSAAACERCRKRKQKCDGKLPVCGSCASARASCVPSHRLIVRSFPDENTPALQAQVFQLQATVQELTAQLASYRSNGSNADNNNQSHPLDSNATSDVGSPAMGPRKHQHNADIAYCGRILRPTFTMSEARVNDSHTPAWSSPWHLWGDDVAAHPTSGRADPTFVPLDTCASELVDVYFRERWPQLPILDRDVFMQRHYLPLSAGLPAETLSSFQVYMVLAIASAATGPTDGRWRFSHKDYFLIAVRDLHLVIGSDDLDCIQCLLLLCMYGSNEPQSVNMWYTTGLALRLAVGIDLHRVETIANLDLVQAETSKRLFWGAYVMDRVMSIALGRPLGIQETDITTPLPLRVTDTQINTMDNTSIGNSMSPREDDASTFIHIVKLRRINAEIYKEFHAAGNIRIDNTSLEALRSTYYGQLNDWLVSAPRYAPTVPMLQTPEWFQIAYHQGVLSLYRPSQGAPVSSIESLSLCTDSAISLISCYRTLHAKNKIAYTFVALNSLFMAAVTMLYCLRASSAIRKQLSRPVVEVNIHDCLKLLRDLSRGRAVGERCAIIVERLGRAVTGLFDRPAAQGEVLDTEFLSWFGIRAHSNSIGMSQDQHDATLGQTQRTLSIDTPWNDIFNWGFDASGSGHMDIFV